MAYARDYCVPSQDSIQSQVHSQIENLNRRLEETSDLLRCSAPRRRPNDRQQLDRLALRLKKIEEQRELPRVHKRDDRDDSNSSWTSKERDEGPKGESLHIFFQWRKQLIIFYDALGDAIEELLQFDGRKARRAVEELLELKDDIASSLVRTAKWTQEDLDSLVCTNTVREQRSFQSSKKKLRSIAHEAESVRQLSHTLSTQMKGQLEGLKSDCVALAKDLVAMNRILEGRKQALVE